MFDRLTRAFGYALWQNGFFGALKATFRWFLQKLRLSGYESALSTLGKRDLLESYGRVLQEPVPPLSCLPTEAHRRVLWVIPPFSVGSGGHLNIFRMVRMLEERGFQCLISVDGAHVTATAEELRAQIRQHFVAVDAEVIVGVDDAPPVAFAFATSWTTAYTVAAFERVVHRLYFVQDFEPLFYPAGSEYFMAERTYRFGLTAVTAGDWLAEKLAAEFGMQTRAIGFSFDKDRYRPLPRRDGDGKRRVFFYARHVTPRRGFEMGILVLTLLWQRHPDLEFILAGWDSDEFMIPFPHLNAGVVGLDDLPGLYAECDAALVLSFTNLSLLPLELMACGCPVVSNRGANVEWLLRDEDNALLCDPVPAALAEALSRLLHDSELRERLIAGGLRAAASTSWDAEGDRVKDLLDQLPVTECA
ncbi:MAG: glycosyltransferase family 4 protein [Halothiobacillaceae bacterium]